MTRTPDRTRSRSRGNESMSALARRQLADQREVRRINEDAEQVDAHTDSAPYRAHSSGELSSRQTGAN